MKIPPKKDRIKWRKKRGSGMVSAVGEYTPDEFWVLLDAVDRLEKSLEEIANYQGMKLAEVIDIARSAMSALGGTSAQKGEMVGGSYKDWLNSQ